VKLIEKCYKRCFFVNWTIDYKGATSNMIFFNILTTYDGQMKEGKNTSNSHFQDLFWWSCLTWSELLPGLIMATQNYPTCIAWKCTQYCYIHGTQILKQIDQCKKGLRLERCSKVSIDTIKERKKTIMSTIGLKELEIEKKQNYQSINGSIVTTCKESKKHFLLHVYLHRQCISYYKKNILIKQHVN
jgi:hypothetical protein